eukprot:scaffold118525_cov27-Prasinocladus_malaysianus.AAC.1
MDGDEDDWDFDLLDRLVEDHKASKGPNPQLPQANPKVLSNSTNLLRPTQHFVKQPPPCGPQQATVKQLWRPRGPAASQQGVSYQVGGSTFHQASHDDGSWEALTHGYMAGCEEWGSRRYPGPWPRHHP